MARAIPEDVIVENGEHFLVRRGLAGVPQHPVHGFVDLLLVARGDGGEHQGLLMHAVVAPDLPPIHAVQTPANHAPFDLGACLLRCCAKDRVTRDGLAADVGRCADSPDDARLADKAEQLTVIAGRAILGIHGLLVVVHVRVDFSQPVEDHQCLVRIAGVSTQEIGFTECIEPRQHGLPQQRAAVPDKPESVRRIFRPPAIAVIGVGTREQAAVFQSCGVEGGEVIAGIGLPADGTGDVPRVGERIVFEIPLRVPNKVMRWFMMDRTPGGVDECIGTRVDVDRARYHGIGHDGSNEGIIPVKPAGGGPVRTIGNGLRSRI